jgi:DNA-binding response OmpR family regulator
MAPGQHHTDRMAKVLVVEDDPAILETVAYNLGRDGHDVLTAGDGVRGLELAREGEPDLIVLDLMLPRISGLDICRILRKEHKPVPIVMLTALDTEAQMVEGLDLGADDYVTKPFSMRELMARVTAALRRDQISRAAADPGSGELLEAGELVLDVGAHEARRDGAVVPLRPKEFQLLEYMMRHRGQALSRDRILESVWGYSYAGGTRTVDVHVRWLREKVERDPSKPQHLVTVRGLGYKFVL